MCQLDELQGSTLFFAPGLVKFVSAVARLFRLALPGSFLTMFAQNKGDLCMLRWIYVSCYPPSTMRSPWLRQFAFVSRDVWATLLI